MKKQKSQVLDDFEEKEGYLWKKGGIYGFDKRWFLLTANKKLHYFADDTKVKELGEIDLYNIKDIFSYNVIHNSESHYGFKLETTLRTFQIYATTIEERDEWHDLIKGEIESIDHGDTFLHRVILGIKTSIRSEPNRKIPITNIDYRRTVIHHIKRPFQSKVSVEEFSPSIFGNIRQNNSVKQLVLLDAWDLPETKLKSEGSAGKSGSMFVISNDRNFFIKSIEKREKLLLIRMLHDYHKHILKYPKSLLMKLYGFYRYLASPMNQSFVMFNNFLNLSVSIEEKYDLKGSTKDREASAKEKLKTSPILLDLDFTNLNRKLKFGDKIKNNFMEQLKIDAQLLARYNVMDYSLLVGIHKINEQDNHILKNKKFIGRMFFDSSLGNRVCTILSDDKTEIYFVGIIDCLTVYDMEKKVAHVAKSTKWSAEELSTVNAQFYSDRFCSFINSVIE